SPEMKESKAYKTYLSYTTGAVPPKIARKFKKVSPSKKDSVPIQADKEPVDMYGNCKNLKKTVKNGRARKEPGECYQKWSTQVNLWST
ncbi:hypothetical protein Tco_0479933, partial [Tanacetum coccineum]